MSKAAYEAYFGQAAPPNAVFAADISYWQGTDIWYNLSAWADSVCIRTSYGSGGNDGRQNEHFNKAAEIGYKGTLGTYHYIIPNSGMPGNLSNYLSRSAPFVDRTKYDMLDFEESPVASNVFIDDMCDAVEQDRQRPCLIYGGKSYLDQAGPIDCPAAKFWVAHYAARASNAWVPTNDWSSWNAPLMPNQYGLTLPGVWQWSSSAIGFSLDLDISTTPEAFGIGALPPVEKEMFTVSQYDDLMYRLNMILDRMKDEDIMFRENMLLRTTRKCTMVETSKGWWMTDGIGVVPLRTPQAVMDAVGSGFLTNEVNDQGQPIPHKISDALFDTFVRVDKVLDVDYLANAIAAKVVVGGSVDYEKVRTALRDELAKLHLTQG